VKIGIKILIVVVLICQGLASSAYSEEATSNLCKKIGSAPWLFGQGQLRHFSDSESQNTAFSLVYGDERAFVAIITKNDFFTRFEDNKSGFVFLFFGTAVRASSFLRSQSSLDKLFDSNVLDGYVASGEMKHYQIFEKPIEHFEKATTAMQVYILHNKVYLLFTSATNEESRPRRGSVAINEFITLVDVFDRSIVCQENWSN